MQKLYTYRYRIMLGLLPALLLLLPGCVRKLDLPDIQGKKSICMLGELVAGDSFYLRAGQSLPLASGNELKFEVLKGLTLNVTDAQGNKFPLNEGADIDTLRLLTVPFESPQTVMEGHTYNISASHPELGIANAEVEIPGAFRAEMISMEDAQYSSEQVVKVTFRIDDPGTTANYYVVEVMQQSFEIRDANFYYNGKWISIEDNLDLYYSLIAQGNALQVQQDTFYQRYFLRQTMYSDDMLTDNVVEKGIYNRNRRVLLKDNTFNGSSHTSQVYIRPEMSTSFTYETGRVLLLLVKSVPEKYYRFLKAYEGFSDAGGFSTFSQPVKVEGNVGNGVGMVGGAYVIRIPLQYTNPF